MGLFEVSEEKRRAKEIRKEGKELRKSLLTAGLEKKYVDIFLEEYLACVEHGTSQKEVYQKARGHMVKCLRLINEMLPQMRELPPAVCRAKLQTMLEDLPYVCHDCLIRKDDLDYEATLRYITEKVPTYIQDDRLMMQSELENLKSVFDDAKEWDAPNFIALAFFLRHERSEMLSDMENSQRNAYIERFYDETFWDAQKATLGEAKALDMVEQFAEKWMHSL